MVTFIKAQGSSLVATLADFLLTILLTEVFGVWYAAANVTGVIAGGIVNFAVNRHWVFDAAETAVRKQASRYVLVWCGNLLLNAFGVYAVTRYLIPNYILSKVLVALAVGWGYNYTLQKKFVFKQPDHVT